MFLGSLTQFISHSQNFFIWGGGPTAWQPPFFRVPLLYAANIKHLLLTEKHNLSHSDVFHAIRILRLCTVTLEALCIIFVV